MKTISLRTIAIVLAAAVALTVLIIVSTSSERPPRTAPTSSAATSAESAPTVVVVVPPTSSARQRRVREASAPRPTPSARPNTPAATSAEILSLRQTVYLGTTQLVVAKTSPNAFCSIEVLAPDGSPDDANALVAKNADAEGRISWGWEIIDLGLDPSLTRITMTVNVTCGAFAATKNYELRL